MNPENAAAQAGAENNALSHLLHRVDADLGYGFETISFLEPKTNRFEYLGHVIVLPIGPPTLMGMKNSRERVSQILDEKNALTIEIDSDKKGAKELIAALEKAGFTPAPSGACYEDHVQFRLDFNGEEGRARYDAFVKTLYETAVEQVVTLSQEGIKSDLERTLQDRVARAKEALAKDSSLIAELRPHATKRLIDNANARIETELLDAMRDAAAQLTPPAPKTPGR